jgi:hypothetical protein
MVMAIGIRTSKAIHPLRFGYTRHYQAIYVSYFSVVSFEIDAFSDFSDLVYREKCEGKVGGIYAIL